MHFSFIEELFSGLDVDIQIEAFDFFVCAQIWSCISSEFHDHQTGVESIVHVLE